MLEPWQFLIVALAAGRITRFFVYDSLIGAHLSSGSAFSEVLDQWAFTPGPPPAGGQDRSFVRGKVGSLLVCPWCIGFWLTLGCWAAAYWGGSWAMTPLAAVAMTYAGSWFARLSDRT